MMIITLWQDNPMGAYYSKDETQPAAKRETDLLARLPDFIAHAKQHAPAYQELYRDISPQDICDINSRQALAELPAVNKTSLISAQESNPPFAGFDCFDFDTPLRFYISPGPIAECDFDSDDFWRTAAAFYAAGLRQGMLLHNSFSYHFTPAGQMCEAGALSLGARVFPAGGGNSEQQARAIAQLRPQCYCGTPDFLRVILEAGDAAKVNTSSICLAAVTGGYLSPELLTFYQARNIDVRQWYGTADCGIIAFESEVGAPLIVTEGILVEVVNPQTRMPCAPNEKGEVLITNFNRAFPLIRYALGDLSAIVEGESPCGRTNMRLAGWLGRCDLSVKIRGMFVHPAQVLRALSRMDEVKALQLCVRTIDGKDAMMLHCVMHESTQQNDEMQKTIIAILQEETKLRGEVVFVDEIEGEVILDSREN